jgi:hypothetical protein
MDMGIEEPKARTHGLLLTFLEPKHVTDEIRTKRPEIITT